MVLSSTTKFIIYAVITLFFFLPLAEIKEMVASVVESSMRLGKLEQGAKSQGWLYLALKI